MPINVGSNSISGIQSSLYASDASSYEFVSQILNSQPSLPNTTGNGGKFLTTQDGTTLTWSYLNGESQYSSPGSYSFTVPKEATMLHVQAIGGGQGGSSYISYPNLTNSWTSVTDYLAAGFTDIIYDEYRSVYWATTQANRVLSSTNALNWTEIGAPRSGLWISGIAAGPNNLVVAYGYPPLPYQLNNGSDGRGAQQISSSTNGVNWVVRTGYGGVTGQGGPYYYICTKVEYEKNMFHITGAEYTNPAGSPYETDPFISTSTDGIVWRYNSGIGGFKGLLDSTGGDSRNFTQGVATDGNVLISVFMGTFGSFVFGPRIIATTDPSWASWTYRTSAAPVGVITRERVKPMFVKYAGQYFIEGGSHAHLQVSTDSIVWSLRTTGRPPKQATSGASGTDILSAFYSNVMQFYAFSDSSGALCTSTDTVVWTVRTTFANPIGISTGGGGAIYAKNLTHLWGGSNTTMQFYPYLYGGSGGKAGSYASSYISLGENKPSTLNITVGSGGQGGTAGASYIGQSGSSSVISWSGATGTYSITALGGGLSGISTYASGAQIVYDGFGYWNSMRLFEGNGLGSFEGLSNSNYYPHAGSGGQGSVSLTSSYTGGDGGGIAYYGFTANGGSGGSSGSNGSNGTTIPNIPYGSGGGAGGSTINISGSGGVGGRGAGGGGAGWALNIGSSPGGSGGNGYVSITWT